MVLFSPPAPQSHSGADLCSRFLPLLPCQCKVWRHKCPNRTSADRNPKERHSWAMEDIKTHLQHRFLGDCDPQSEEQTGCAPSRRLLSSQNTGQAHNAHSGSSIPPKPAEIWGQEVKIPLILLIIPPLSCWLSTLVIFLAEELMENTSMNSCGDKKLKSAVIRKF